MQDYIFTNEDNTFYCKTNTGCKKAHIFYEKSRPYFLLQGQDQDWVRNNKIKCKTTCLTQDQD